MVETHGAQHIARDDGWGTLGGKSGVDCRNPLMPRSKPPRRKPTQETTKPQKTAAVHTSTSQPQARWKLRLTRTAKILIFVLTLALGVIGTPLIFGLSVQDPLPVFAGEPFSIPFEITNQNVLPYSDIDYSCDIDEAVLVRGQHLRRIRATPADSFRPVLYGFHSMTARCENQYIFPPDEKFVRADISLTIGYRPMLWPIRRTMAKTYTAIINPRSGHIERWVPK